MLLEADEAAHGIDQPRGIVANTIVEDDFHVFDVGNSRRGIAADHYHREFAGGEGAPYMNARQLR